MDDNILTDIPWIITTEGKKTIGETLLLSHVEGFNISKEQEGFFYGAQIRILTQIAILAIRNTAGGIDHVLDNGFSQESLTETFEQLDDGAHLRSGKYPFMQWPLDTDVTGKTQQNVEKLLSTGASSDFWDLGSRKTALSLEDATLWATVWGLYSMAGNTVIQGKRHKNCAPAGRGDYAGRTATEIIFEGETLSETLINCADTKALLSKNTDDLPAWADREGTRSNTLTEMGPLWKLSWSSNACLLHWENDEVVKVSLGGVPNNWLPTGFKESGYNDALKNWDADRDVEDAFYMYAHEEKNGETKPRLKEIPYEISTTEMMLRWVLEGAYAFKKPRPGVRTKNPVILQHKLSDDFKTPLIRSSRVLDTDPSLWILAGNTDPDVVRNVKMLAEYVNDVRGCLEKAMQKRKDPESQKGYVFDEDFTPIRRDVLETFWNNLEQTYRKAALSFEEGEEFDQRIQRDIKTITVETFRDVTQPLQFTNPRKVFQATKRLQTLLHRLDEKENSNE